MEYTEHNQKHTCHQCGNRKTFEAILLDNAVYNNNERARRTTNLYFRSAKDRDNQSCYNSGDNTLFRRHSRRDTEGDGQWKGHDTDYNTCQQIGCELTAVIVPDGLKQFRLKCQ